MVWALISTTVWLCLNLDFVLTLRCTEMRQRSQRQEVNRRLPSSDLRTYSNSQNFRKIVSFVARRLFFIPHNEDDEGNLSPSTPGVEFDAATMLP